MERLTKKDGLSKVIINFGDKNDIFEVYNRLAELEDKIESGLNLELPCKIGTTIYGIDKDCTGCPQEQYGYDDWDCAQNGYGFDNRITCEDCAKRIKIIEHEFNANDFERIYQTKQFRTTYPNQEVADRHIENYDTVYFLTREEAEQKRQELIDRFTNKKGATD